MTKLKIKAVFCAAPPHPSRTQLKMQEPLCTLKGAAWWAARLCSSILLILSSAERLVSVGDGGTMEVISLISGLPLWPVILLMFISEKSHGLCLCGSVIFALLDFLSSFCSSSLCCVPSFRRESTHHQRKMNRKTVYTNLLVSLPSNALYRFQNKTSCSFISGAVGCPCLLCCALGHLSFGVIINLRGLSCSPAVIWHCWVSISRGHKRVRWRRWTPQWKMVGNVNIFFCFRQRWTKQFCFLRK